MEKVVLMSKSDRSIRLIRSTICGGIGTVSTEDFLGQPVKRGVSTDYS